MNEIFFFILFIILEVKFLPNFLFLNKKQTFVLTINENYNNVIIKHLILIISFDLTVIKLF